VEILVDFPMGNDQNNWWIFHTNVDLLKADFFSKITRISWVKTEVQPHPPRQKKFVINWDLHAF